MILFVAVYYVHFKNLEHWVYDFIAYFAPSKIFFYFVGMLKLDHNSHDNIINMLLKYLLLKSI